MHPSLRTLLLGTYDEHSTLIHLGGHSDELSYIWRLVKNKWAEEMLADSLADEECIAFAHVDTTRFPQPNDRNVNMMPFLLDDVESLPENLRCYWPMIEQCTATLVDADASLPSLPGRRRKSDGSALAGRVGYLTVQEGIVPKGSSQRRPGLHTEGFTRLPCEGGTCVSSPYWHGWGFGHAMNSGAFDGGIFLASSVNDSCHVFNARVPPELVGRGGDIEHLRATLQQHLPAPPKPRLRREPRYSAMPNSPSGAPVGHAHMSDYGRGGGRANGPISLQKNELFWITDRTPHESMPVEEATHRQFFRLVAGKIDCWFAAHSSPNPLGTLPHARIVDVDKFTGCVPPRALTERSADADAAPSTSSPHAPHTPRRAAWDSWREMGTALLAAARQAQRPPPSQ